MEAVSLSNRRSKPQSGYAVNPRPEQGALRQEDMR
jgi:hypothetical protein